MVSPVKGSRPGSAQGSEPTSSAPARVLLAIEDEAVLVPMRTLLDRLGYLTLVTSEPEEILNQVESTSPELLIGETHLLTGNGNPLLRWVHQNRPNTRILLLLEFSELHLAQTTAELGCERFLTKPFTAEELAEAVGEALDPGEALELDEASFARIAIEDFIYGKSIPYHLHVRRRDRKFVKVAQAGQNVDLDLIDRFKARGLSELWLHRDDFNQYLQLSQKAASLASQRPDFADTQRTRLVRHACEVAAENIRLMGISENTLQPALLSLQSTLTVVSSHSVAMTLLDTIERKGSASYTHAVTCAILCGVVARVMGWYSEKNIFALTLGGYLHDVGIYQLPFELQSKDPAEMSDSELAIYKQHPLLGARVLEKIGNIPPEVIQIVQQHHENRRGTGFPAALTNTNMFPMAKTVALVDVFAERLLELDPRMRSTAPQVLDNILTEHPNHFDDQSALALRIVLTEPDAFRARMAYDSRCNRLGRVS